MASINSMVETLGDHINIRATSDYISYYLLDMAELDEYVALLNEQAEINNELEKVIAKENNAQRRKLSRAKLSMNRHATALAKMHVGRTLRENHEKRRKWEERSWEQLELAKKEISKMVNGDETEDEEEQGDLTVASST